MSRINEKNHNYNNKNRQKAKGSQKSAKNKNSQKIRLIPVPASKASYGFLALYVILIGLTLFMITNWWGAYMSSRDSAIQLNTLKKEYEKLTLDKSSLELQIEQNTNLESIKIQAEQRLGMEKPGKYQMNYVYIKKPDITVIKEDTVVESGFMAFLRQKLSLIVAFLQ